MTYKKLKFDKLSGRDLSTYILKGKIINLSI